MELSELAGRRQSRLFGRADTIERITSRLSSAGIILLPGRAQAGKSRLLAEIAANRIAEGGLVGYVEAFDGEPDLFLRAVADLYLCWLAQASSREQAVRLLRSCRPQIEKLNLPLENLGDLDTLQRRLQEEVASSNGCAVDRTGGSLVPHAGELSTPFRGYVGCTDVEKQGHVVSHESRFIPSDEAFLQPDISVGTIPDGLEVRGQTLEFLSGGDDDPPSTLNVLIDAVFDLADALQRLIPAPLQLVDH
jgi:hypothetical protein